MLKRYLRQHATALLAITLLSGINCLVMMRLLAFTNNLAANGIGDRSTALTVELALLSAWLVTAASSQSLLARLGAKLVEQLRMDLALRFLAIDYEKVANRDHLILSAVIQDVTSVSQLVLNGPQFIYNLLLVFLFCSYLFGVSGPLFTILIAFVIPTLLIHWRVSLFTRPRFDRLRQSEDVFNEHLRAVTRGKKELSLDRARAGHFLDHLLRPAAARTRSLLGHLHLTWAIYDSWSNVVLNFAIFLVVYVGYTALEVPSATMLEFVLGGIFVIRPLNLIAMMVHGMGNGMASLRHLEQIGLDLDAEIQARPLPCALEPDACREWKAIAVDQVVYRYAQVSGDSEQRGVGPISLTIRRGETLFLVGGNGSGKSTLLLLVCGLLQPSEGEIRIDGRSARDNLDAYRAMFCGTFSDCFVFRHVLDSFGIIKDDDEVNEMLKKYALAGQVQSNDGELSRLELSTGQRKRLALIQSLAQDRDIFFFDEWAAEQDPTFRGTFYGSVLPDLKRRGKTVIAISHDDRYFDLADRIIKLDGGVLASDSPAGQASPSVDAECASA